MEKVIICIDCVHSMNVSTDPSNTHFLVYTCNTGKNRIDFVTGKRHKIIESCYEKNDGTCPDYEARRVEKDD